MLRTKKLILLSAVLLIAVSSIVFAAGGSEAAYPTRPVELVVPMGAGGSHDLHARAISLHIEKYLGAPLSVTLKPGGTGAIGTKYVADSRKDGYTLIFGGSGPNTALPIVQDVGYNRDTFTPIAMINYAPVYFIVRDDSPFYSIQDLIDYIKQHPGELNYASGGPFGNLHIPQAQLWSAAGVYGDIEHVPYAGGGPALIALLEGSVAVTTALPGALNDHIKAGTIRALAVTNTKRVIDGIYDDVPTLIELGYDVTFQMWRAVMAPVGIPEDVEMHLRDSFAKLSKDPAFQKDLLKMGERIDLYMDGPEYKKEIWDQEQSQIEDVLKLMMEKDG